MKLTIEIELGTDALQTYYDLRYLLTQTFAQYGITQALKVGDGASMKDLNGNTVGCWGITGNVCALCHENEATVGDNFCGICLGGEL